MACPASRRVCFAFGSRRPSPAGRAKPSESVRKRRVRASVPVPPNPSDPLGVRVADRVAERFAWQDAWQFVAAHRWRGAKHRVSRLEMRNGGEDGGIVRKTGPNGLSHKEGLGTIRNRKEPQSGATLQRSASARSAATESNHQPVDRRSQIAETHPERNTEDHWRFRASVLHVAASRGRRPQSSH